MEGQASFHFSQLPPEARIFLHIDMVIVTCELDFDVDGGSVVVNTAVVVPRVYVVGTGVFAVDDAETLKKS